MAGTAILNPGTGGPGFTEEPSYLEQQRASHDANPKCLLAGCCMLGYGYDGRSGLLGRKSWARQTTARAEAGGFCCEFLVTA